MKLPLFGQALLLAAVVAGGLLAGCGGGTALPDAEACPNPTPTPTSRSASGQQTRYRRTVTDGETLLRGLIERFRGEYPDDTFYRRDAFRPDFAGWAAASVCVVANLKALNPPAVETLQGFDVTFEVLLDDFAATVQKGSEAVRARNTSDYKSFYARLDDVVARLRAHVGAIP